MALTVAKMTRTFDWPWRSAFRSESQHERGRRSKRFNAVQYPELATAVVNGPEAAADKMLYTFDRAIGSKG